MADEKTLYARLGGYNAIAAVADNQLYRRTTYRISKPTPFVSAGRRMAVPAGSSPLAVVKSVRGNIFFCGKPHRRPVHTFIALEIITIKIDSVNSESWSPPTV